MNLKKGTIRNRPLATTRLTAKSKAMVCAHPGSPWRSVEEFPL
ncbi:MAG: hypothetical protein A4E72_00362 [Syntrophus sp. PtaU1.Bin208]|nr:MAG: hypothetical protein A4E72_00362 [Syntrophus sp. PtaU1.Bin208]